MYSELIESFDINLKDVSNDKMRHKVTFDIGIETYQKRGIIGLLSYPENDIAVKGNVISDSICKYSIKEYNDDTYHTYFYEFNRGRDFVDLVYDFDCVVKNNPDHVFIKINKYYFKLDTFDNIIYSIPHVMLYLCHVGLVLLYKEKPEEVDVKLYVKNVYLRKKSHDILFQSKSMIKYMYNYYMMSNILFKRYTIYELVILTTFILKVKNKLLKKMYEPGGRLFELCQEKFIKN